MPLAAHVAALTLSLTAIDPSSSGPPAVSVRLYQPFGPAGETAAVQAGVDRIFARAGVAVRWVDCSAQARHWPADSPCNQTATAGQVILRLLATPPAARRSCSHGFALVPPDGRMGVFATVFVDRRRALQEHSDASAVQMLSHFTAHEIGHLLLGQGHSDGGIMRAVWSGPDLDSAAQGRLTFTAAQGERMRANLRAVTPPAATGPAANAAP